MDRYRLVGIVVLVEDPDRVHFSPYSSSNPYFLPSYSVSLYRRLIVTLKD
jgi:hypothetical protein